LPRKKRSTRKKKVVNKAEPEITDEMEADLIKGAVGYGDTEGSIPLEDMPLHMQKETEATPPVMEEETLIPSGFDMAEPIKKITDPGPPKHYGCGGALHPHGSDGVGRWWECAKCRSQFYFKSMKNKGSIGNPREASILYKVDSRPKKGRRLT